MLIQNIKIDELKPFDGNPRKISKEGLEKIKNSILKYGFTNPILVQKSTNIVIAGHQRIKAAKLAGLVEVPIIYLDFDDVHTRAYNIADNKLAEESEWLNDDLLSMLDELKLDGFDLLETGFDESEVLNLYKKDLEEVKLEKDKEEDNQNICPSCGHVF